MAMHAVAKLNRRMVSALLALLIALSCIANYHVIGYAEEPIPPVQILTEPLGDRVSIHSELQEQYLNGPLEEIASYADGTTELSRPAKLTLTWNTVIDEDYAAQTDVSAEGCEQMSITSKLLELFRWMQFSLRLKRLNMLLNLAE